MPKSRTSRGLFLRAARRNNGANEALRDMNEALRDMICSKASYTSDEDDSVKNEWT